MKYALIGCGRISVNNIQAALNNKLEIVGICDLLTERMKEKKEKFPDIKDVPEYIDYIEMIEKEKPELVAIATESGEHARIALDCIRHGINVIIEKPIALSMKDAKEIIEEAKKYNVKVCANHQNRFNKAIQKMHLAIEENKFGKIFHGTAHICWNRGKQYYDQAPWRGTWAQDGGALMNQCIHDIDLLRWMMGNEVDEVFAYTDRLNHDFIEAEDLGVALVKFKNGAYGMIEGTTNVYPKNLEETLYLFGETGTCKLGGKSCNAIEAWEFKDNNPKDEEFRQLYEQTINVYGNGHGRLFANMIDCIKNDKQPLVDARAGKRALELVLAIYKSQKEGMPVKLPLEDFASVDMIGEFADADR